MKNEKEIKKKLQLPQKRYGGVFSQNELIVGMLDTRQTQFLFLSSCLDMPCAAQNLSVSIEDSEVNNIIESIQSLGDVQMLGSLQIVELTEQAGGILVQWDEVYMNNYIKLP